MSGPEPGWDKHPRATHAFTRPLLGSELWFDKALPPQYTSRQFAIGIQFTTTIPEHNIEASVKEAAVRLRFECPLVAATIEQGIHHPEFGSWVYAPLPSADAARVWANNAVHYVPEPADPASFLQSTVEKNELPYVLTDGSEQYLRVYLTRLSSAPNAYCLSLHAAHSIMDAKPGLNAMSLLLEWMTTSGLESVDELAWGTEHKNLPPGPITVTGGPRKDWSTNGMALVEKFQSGLVNQTLAHGLDFDVSRSRNNPPGNVHRVLVKFTVTESARIVQALKSVGFRYSELLSAACALAAFEQNRVPTDRTETAYVKSDIIISLTDRLPAPVDRRKHLVSCLVFAPYQIDYAPLAALPRGRARLHAAMRQAKAQYDWLLANPCLPHLLAELCPHIVPSKEAGAPSVGPYVPLATNIGRVEDCVARVWPRDGSGWQGPAVRVDDMHIAGRMGTSPAPVVHAWSMQGRLSVLLQAGGGWDEDVLQGYMNELARQISLVMSE